MHLTECASFGWAGIIPKIELKSIQHSWKINDKEIPELELTVVAGPGAILGSGDRASIAVTGRNWLHK
jgi:hypothetical protein